jgi:hypothetical protein
MPEYVPAPTYPTPNYQAFANTIGNLPADYRNAQEQQGNIDYVALLRQHAQEAQTPSPLWSLPSSLAAPAQPTPQPQPAPMQQPAAPAPASPPLQASVSDGSGPPPTLAALVSGAAPDPTKVAPTTAFLAKVLNVDPAAPLTPDQVGRAQRVMANLLKPSVGGPAMGGPEPPQSGFVGRLNVPPDPAVAGASAIAAPPLRAAATPSASGGAGGPFSLPPAAEAIWGRMVTQESGGNQFNRDGSVLTSSEGAVGIAQVMPGTGPTAAKLAGLPWDPVRFKNDPNYNIALGKAFYAQQVRAFGSPDIAAAAYNAGPKAIVSAMAKATSRGGSWLDYVPDETKDYVAKVTGGGGAPQAGGGGAAPVAQGGARPLGPQVPLPPAANGDPQRAILMIRQEAGLRRDRGAPGQAAELDQWADAIAKSTELREVRPGETLVDPATGEIRLRTPATNANSVALQRYLEQNPDATPQQIQAFTRAGQAPRSAAGMALQRFLEENPNADADEIQAFNAQAAGQSLLSKRTVAFESAENEAKALIPAVRTAAAAVTSTNYPDVNKIIQAGLMHSGDPNVVKLGVAMESLSQAYARALSPTGSPLASDKEHAHAILQQYWSVGQINAALDQMETEIARAKQSLNTTRKDLGAGSLKGGDAAPPARSATGGGGGASGQPARVTKEQYDALPKGTPFIAVDDPTQTPRTKP